jgi:tetratricopeptide (TPR) repeat protein
MLSATLLLLTLTAAPQAGVDPPSQPTIAQARSLQETGKLSEARDAYEAILAASPADAGALDGEVQTSERLALNARAAGDWNDALADLVRAQKFAPESPRLLSDLGILEEEMQLYHDADETLGHLERLRPGDPTTLYAVARVKLDLGQLAMAEEKMKAYLALKPDDASAHYGLGRIYRQGLQFDKARAEFERSIALQPAQTEAYYELGDAELAQGDYLQGLANFDKTLAADPKHGGALTGSGIAYFKQKEYEKAADFLAKATTAAPEYQPGHYYLGLTLARLGKKDESDRELAVAARLAEEDNKHASNRLRLNTPDAGH